MLDAFEGDGDLLVTLDAPAKSGGPRNYRPRKPRQGRAFRGFLFYERSTELG
jgi:hypothetical protein